MTILVVGASGATGKLLVDQLLNAGQKVKVIVRTTSHIPASWIDNENISVIRSNVMEMRAAVLADHLKDCHAVASCLGHHPTWKGIYGKPRRLVADTVGLLCEAISNNTPEKPVRFVLMNTAGNSNRDLAEPISAGQKLVTGLLRLLLPPHADNEKAADHLRVNIGQKNRFVEWVVVRPDTLFNEEKVSGYSLHASPARDAIFNPGRTSRINVAHFMATLLTDNNIWKIWQGQMPVIYNVLDR